MAFQKPEHYSRDYFEVLVQRYLNASRFMRVRIRNVFELLGGVAGRTVADLGCGMGTFTLEVARRGGRGVGLDAAPAGLYSALHLARELEVEDQTMLVGADVATLPLGDVSIDHVIAADLTEHLDDHTLEAMLREIARVLRPGGTLALYTPSPSHLFERLKEHNLLLKQDPSHIGLRSMERLKRAVQDARLEISRAYYRPTHLPIFSLLERILARAPWIGGLFRRRICILAVRPGGVDDKKNTPDG